MQSPAFLPKSQSDDDAEVEDIRSLAQGLLNNLKEKELRSLSREASARVGQCSEVGSFAESTLCTRSVKEPITVCDEEDVEVERTTSRDGRPPMCRRHSGSNIMEYLCQEHPKETEITLEVLTADFDAMPAGKSLVMDVVDNIREPTTNLDPEALYAAIYRSFSLSDSQLLQDDKELMSSHSESKQPPYDAQSHSERITPQPQSLSSSMGRPATLSLKTRRRNSDPPEKLSQGIPREESLRSSFKSEHPRSSQRRSSDSRYSLCSSFSRLLEEESRHAEGKRSTRTFMDSMTSRDSDSKVSSSIGIRTLSNRYDDARHPEPLRWPRRTSIDTLTSKESSTSAPSTQGNRSVSSQNTSSGYPNHIELHDRHSNRGQSRTLRFINNDGNDGRCSLPDTNSPNPRRRRSLPTDFANPSFESILLALPAHLDCELERHHYQSSRRANMHPHEYEHTARRHSTPEAILAGMKNEEKSREAKHQERRPNDIMTQSSRILRKVSRKERSGEKKSKVKSAVPAIHAYGSSTSNNAVDYVSRDGLDD